MGAHYYNEYLQELDLEWKGGNLVRTACAAPLTREFSLYAI
jgi:hypothetical protein